MGLDLNETRFLLAAKASGVCFTKTATLGRQEFRLGFHGLKKELSAFGITQPDAAIERLVTEGNGYAEPFLRMLGAQQICSIDSSAYENASLVHDMNLPVPSEVLNAFTVVIDGGSL